MFARPAVVALVMCCASIAPPLLKAPSAAPIPGYFEEALVGFACVTAAVPGGGSSPVLLQLNFDTLAGGGITPAGADSLFARLTSSFGWLSQLTGATYQLTCTHTPTQIQASYPGLTALQAVRVLAGSFGERGFAAYMILDTFRGVTPTYLGASVATVRTDAFRVTGLETVSYLGSFDAAQ